MASEIRHETVTLDAHRTSLPQEILDAVATLRLHPGETAHLAVLTAVRRALADRDAEEVQTDAEPIRMTAEEFAAMQADHDTPASDADQPKLPDERLSPDDLYAYLENEVSDAVRHQLDRYDIYSYLHEFYGSWDLDREELVELRAQVAEVGAIYGRLSGREKRHHSEVFADLGNLGRAIESAVVLAGGRVA
jgi:hypothetical protein